MIKKQLILPMIAIVSITSLLFYGPFSQEQSYHDFADKRIMFGIPNFLNVITNLPFAIIGLIGIWNQSGSKQRKLQHISTILFTSFLLLFAGSSYYHLWPNNETLVYDRIPIAMIMMTFLSFIVYDRIDVHKGYFALILLNVIGIMTVFYWILSEQAGNGDLRWYAMVQFFPLVAIPIIIILYKSEFNLWKEIIPMLIFFGAAKVMEVFDKEIYDLLNRHLSGHSIKHLLMAAAGLEIVLLFRRRIKVVESGGVIVHSESQY